MRKVLSSCIGGILVLLMCSARRPAKAEPEKKVAKGESVMPEKMPTDPRKLLRWYIRWIGREKTAPSMIAGYQAILKKQRSAIKDAYEAEKERSKPKKERLDYYKKLNEWYKHQEEITTELSTQLTQLQLIALRKGAEVDKKRQEINLAIDSITKEFRKHITQRPSKPKSIR